MEDRTYRNLGKCKWCNQDIYGTHHNKLIAHQRQCKLNPNRQQILQLMSKAGKLGGKTTASRKEKQTTKVHIRKCDKCKNEYQIICTDLQFKKEQFKHFCSRACANSRQHSIETKQKISQTNKNRICRIRYCEFCKNKYEFDSHVKTEASKRFCSNACREASKIAKLKITSKKCGGYKPHGGKGKRGWYKGYWCDSSWELAWVIYNLDYGIKFERNTVGFPYQFENEMHEYHPDFKLSDGFFVEIKGWYDSKTIVKHKTFRSLGYKLIVIDKDNIDLYLKYAKEKYGNDFIKVYEK